MTLANRLLLPTGEMTLVPAGVFPMGATRPDADDLEKPCHPVEIGDFYMDVHLVTNGQFARFQGETGYVTVAERIGEGDTFIDGKWVWVPGADWRHPYGPGSTIDGREDHPVVMVSVGDALAYCRWRARVERRFFRLPTEAEWEKAARGTDQRPFPWGHEPVDANGIVRARHLSGAPEGTAPVGSFPAGASPFGIMDMSGNAWDWCLDAMDAGYYRHAPRQDSGGPLSLSGENVFRGGSHLFPAAALSATTRHSNTLSRPSVGIGFRTVCPLRNPLAIRLRTLVRRAVHARTLLEHRRRRRR
jgi:formylglycine-generating enzyme